MHGPNRSHGTFLQKTSVMRNIHTNRFTSFCSEMDIVMKPFSIAKKVSYKSEGCLGFLPSTICPDSCGFLIKSYFGDGIASILRIFGTGSGFFGGKLSNRTFTLSNREYCLMLPPDRACSITMKVHERFNSSFLFNETTFRWAAGNM